MSTFIASPSFRCAPVAFVSNRLVVRLDRVPTAAVLCPCRDGLRLSVEHAATERSTLLEEAEASGVSKDPVCCSGSLDLVLPSGQSITSIAASHSSCWHVPDAHARSQQR